MYLQKRARPLKSHHLRLEGRQLNSIRLVATSPLKQSHQKHQCELASQHLPLFFEANQRMEELKQVKLQPLRTKIHLLNLHTSALYQRTQCFPNQEY